MNPPTQIRPPSEVGEVNNTHQTAPSSKGNSSQANANANVGVGVFLATMGLIFGVAGLILSIAAWIAMPMIMEDKIRAQVAERTAPIERLAIDARTDSKMALRDMDKAVAQLGQKGLIKLEEH